MKLRIYFRPWIIGLLLATSAVLCWAAGLALGWPIGLPLMAFAAAHTALLA